MCCQVRRADHSSRGVLPTMVRRCVLFRNFLSEEALAHWGLSRQIKKKRESRLMVCDSLVSVVTRLREGRLG